MTQGKSSRRGKKGGPTLSDSDMTTKRVYGRRKWLREFGATSLGATALVTVAGTAHSADTDKRELGDKGADRFADSNFADPKTK